MGIERRRYIQTFRLQKIPEHSDLSVVKEYMQMFGNDLWVDFNKFNPLDRTVAPNVCKKITMAKEKAVGTAERYITNSIYHNKPWKRTIEKLAEKRIYHRLAAVIPGEDYLSIEEELNEFYRNLEKEWFYRGFTEGICFLLDLM